MTHTPSALLVSLRDKLDPMAAHEHRCFADAALLPVEAVSVHAAIDGPPSAATLRRHDVIFFGGSGAYSVMDDIPWIRAAMDLLVQVVDLRIPAYGSCFGFQGLSVALGGQVVRDDERAEMGSTLVGLTGAGLADPLFGALPPRFWVQQGHHDRVSRLPTGVTLLVTGDVCHEQALKVDGAPFWASQFHPELDVARTLDRFHHYRDHYLDPSAADERLALLQSGEETPEVSSLLARLARGDF